MTDNEIIKALDCCIQVDSDVCSICPLYDRKKGCIGGDIRKLALDLINRQKAKIERLNIRNKALTAITKNYDWKFAKAKSEARKEFAERLKTNIDEGELYTKHYDYVITMEHIDNLLKEME